MNRNEQKHTAYYKSHTARQEYAQAACWHAYTDMGVHAQTGTQKVQVSTHTHIHTHSQGSQPQQGIVGRAGCMFMCTICLSIQCVSVCIYSKGTAVNPCAGVCNWHAGILCVYGLVAACRSIICATVYSAEARTVTVCGFHSALGMMVKGRMGLLASSSKAVRKHSVAAAAFP